MTSRLMRFSSRFNQQPDRKTPIKQSYTAACVGPSYFGSARRAVRLAARKFRVNTLGSVTVEFVIALPILLAILAFCVQYGNALKVRNNLDVASRDAARYLARAPLNPTATDVDVYFKNKARQIVSARVEKTKSTISSFTPTSNAKTATVAVTIEVPFPLLRWLGLLGSGTSSLSMSSSESWARTGDGVTTSSTSGGS